MDTVFILLHFVAWLVSLAWIGFLVKLEVLDKISGVVQSFVLVLMGLPIFISLETLKHLQCIIGDSHCNNFHILYMYYVASLWETTIICVRRMKLNIVKFTSNE